MQGDMLIRRPPPIDMIEGDVIELDNGIGFEKVKVVALGHSTYVVRRATPWPVIACKVVAWTIIGGFVLLLVACGGGGAPVRPDEPSRLSTTTITVPKTTKCLKRADVPVLPTPTTVDVVNATPDQLAAAAAADAENYKMYAESVAAQLEQCVE